MDDAGCAGSAVFPPIAFDLPPRRADAKRPREIAAVVAVVSDSESQAEEGEELEIEREEEEEEEEEGEDIDLEEEEDEEEEDEYDENDSLFASYDEEEEDEAGDSDSDGSLDEEEDDSSSSEEETPKPAQAAQARRGRGAVNVLSKQINLSRLFYRCILPGDANLRVPLMSLSLYQCSARFVLALAPTPCAKTTRMSAKGCPLSTLRAISSIK